MRLDEEAHAALVDKHGPLPAKRFGDQRHRIGAAVERGGMKLNELQISEGCARTCSHGQAVARRAERVSGVPKQTRGPTGRDHGGASEMEHAGTIAVSDEDTDDAPAMDIEILRERGFRKPHVFRSIDCGAQGADDFSARAIAVRVQDAAATVRRLATERETAAGFAVEACAQRRESLDVACRLTSQNLHHGAIAETPPASSVSRGWRRVRHR